MPSTFEAYRRTPIPVLRAVDGFDRVPIVDCGEGLIPLTQPPNGKLGFRPEYFLRGYHTAQTVCFARRGVANRLLAAANRLPPGFRLLVLDAWRPLALQRELYEREKARLRVEAPDADEQSLDHRVTRYVSLPSDRPDRPSPHLTGGAVDVTIESETSGELDMGTTFDHFGPESGTRFCEERIASPVLGLPDEIHLTNRRLLFHVMSAAGFTNYRYEWWHFDYGNQFWAKVSDSNAIYGPCAP